MWNGENFLHIRVYVCLYIITYAYIIYVYIHIYVYVHMYTGRPVAAEAS